MRATHEQPYRASVSASPVTTDQCAATAQRPLCPTDTVSVQDRRSPTSTPYQWGTAACPCFQHPSESVFQPNNAQSIQICADLRIYCTLLYWWTEQNLKKNSTR